MGPNINIEPNSYLNKTVHQFYQEVKASKKTAPIKAIFLQMCDKRYSGIFGLAKKVMDCVRNFFNGEGFSSYRHLFLNDDYNLEQIKQMKGFAGSITSLHGRLQLKSGKETVISYDAIQDLFRASHLTKGSPEEAIVSEAFTYLHLNANSQTCIIEAILGKSPFRLFDRISVQNTLSDLFGSRLVTDVFKFYGKENHVRITLDDLHALMIGIKANLTLEDVKFIYKNREKLSSLFPGIETLAENQLFELLSLLRTHTPPKNPASIQLKKDLYFLDRCESCSTYKPEESTAEFKEFGHAEFLSRNIVYHLYWGAEKVFFSEGVLFPSYDARRGIKPIVMQAYTNIAGKGLYAVNVIPAEPVIDSKYGLMGATLFRGSHDLDSWWRNFEREGAGHLSFSECQETLVENVRRDLKKLTAGKSSNVSVTWEITGHSLGGCDAQRMAKALAQNPPIQFTRVNTWSFNSPRIKGDVNNAFLEKAKKRSSLQFGIFHARTTGDLIQRFGEVLLGHHHITEPLPKNVNVTVVTFNREKQSIRDAHSLPQTTNDSSAYVAHVATNDDSYGHRKNDEILARRFARIREVKTPA